MRKVITILVALTALFATLQAKTITETRMHIYQNGDNGEWWTPVGDVDSITFSDYTKETIYDCPLEDTYAIIYYDDDNNLLKIENLPYGVTPNYEPKKDGKPKWDITFKEWGPNVKPIDSDASYTAVFDSVLCKYKITFLDYKDSLLHEGYYDYGTSVGIIEYKEPSLHNIPVKANNKYYDYKIKSWESKNYYNCYVYGNDTWKSQLDSTLHQYTIITKEQLKGYTDTTKGSYFYSPDITLLYDSTLRCWRKAIWERDESLISKDTIIYNGNYGAELKTDVEGALSYPFAINDSTFAFISKGNLQYNAGNGKTHKTLDSIAQGTWRFAENQYDRLGEENMKADSSYNGWIDFFPWGSSGWNNGVNKYQPWSTEEGEYGPDGYITGSNIKADWGVYNAIENGGNQPNLWNVLSGEEWFYILDHNKSALAKIGKDSIYCLLIIPNYIKIPEDIKLEYISPTGSYGFKYSSPFNCVTTYAKKNILSEETFSELEAIGVVALPFAGNIHVTSESVEQFNEFGNIWTTATTVFYFGHHDENRDPIYGYIGDGGLSSDSRTSVRLVHILNK